MTQEGLLSISDAVKILNVSRRTLYNWINQGRLNPIRIGKLYRFHPDDIQEFLNKNRVGQSNPIPEPSVKVRILAIDDDMLIRKSLKMLLEKAGFSATLAASGEEALEMLTKETFDVVLTDVRMPGMNGVSTLRAIRNLRTARGLSPIPEVVMSAYHDEPIRDEIKSMGVCDFIAKPFQWDDFLSTIHNSLN